MKYMTYFQSLMFMFISENKGFSLLFISYFGDDMITLLLAKLIFVTLYSINLGQHL